MTRPTLGPSGVYRVRVAIPPHLREITGRVHGKRHEFVENLRTKDAAEAKRRTPEVVERFQGWIRAAQAEHRGAPVRLSDREISRIVGEWLRRQEQAAEDNLSETLESYEDRHSGLGDILQELEDGGWTKDALDATAQEIDPILAAEGLAIDRDSRRRLAVRLINVMHQWAHDCAERHRTGRW